jgi:hypothetical protein
MVYMIFVQNNLQLQLGMQLLSRQLTTSIDIFLQLLHVIQFTCQQVMSQIMKQVT